MNNIRLTVTKHQWFLICEALLAARREAKRWHGECKNFEKRTGKPFASERRQWWYRFIQFGKLETLLRQFENNTEGRFDASNDTLWGESGGQLEYVSQRVVWKQMGEKYEPQMELTFTDHDVQVTHEGDDRFYKLIFPVAAEFYASDG
ncbi:MAG TPA: hypothetical protein V6C76_11510 [Drouetiella sp.]